MEASVRRRPRTMYVLVILASLCCSTIISALTVPPTTTGPYNNGDLRLVNSMDCATEGRLEIFYRGQWGTVCNDNFGLVDAAVSCRQLGFVRGSVVDVRSSGTGPIWLDEVACTESDRTLLGCGHNPPGSHDCGHGEDVYIACFNGSSRVYCPGSSRHDVDEGSIRLVDGACPDEGRIEIFHRNVWGTICDDGFGVEEATVACRQLGFDSGVAMKAPSPGTGTIWLDDLACTLQHRSLAECAGSRWGREDCSHSEDVGIHCFNSTATNDCFGNPVPQDGALRLVGGECSYEGRLEIWHSHRWGTICDDSFNDTDAMVACKQLGHKYGWVHTAPVADSSSRIWLKGINCNETGSRIADCDHNPWGSTYGCDHNRDVGVICSNTSSKLNCKGESIHHGDGDLRLRDGECESHGRLEVYHSGRWGTVCDDSFTDTAAMVACQQLGYKMGFIKSAPAGTGITWLDNVQCAEGASGRLADVCRHADWGQEDCGHSEDIGIQCYNGTGSLDCDGVPFPPDGKLRLSDTSCRYSGRLEVFHGGRWGTVCDVGFSEEAIGVACREMGHTAGGILGATNVTAVASVLAAKRIWLKDVACTGSETTLQSCPHSTWGSSGCDHNQDVFITCKNQSNAVDCNGQQINFEEGQVQLVGGRNSSSGRLEIFHSGRWGTVCDDSFGRTDATVACRQLGFHRGELGSRILAPDGSGPTWLDEVNCLPTNTRIGDCHHNAWGREDCGHSEDVRLLCTNATECDSNPCQNGASCVTGFNMYTCTCVAGYSGRNCETNINECQDNPCVNGATCKDKINDYDCQCVEGYSGKNCSIDIDDCASSPCQNGAQCLDRLRGYDCKCSPGYTGTNCETNINECEPIPCHSGGTCIDGINDFSCTCMPGFTGKRCQTNINECLSNPCKNNGTCLDGNNWFFCKCPSGYYGLICDVKLPNAGKVEPHKNTDGNKAETGKQSGASPVADNTTKNVAIAAIILALIAIVIAVVVIVRWQMLSRQSEGSGDGREDEAAFYSNTSDKVNLVA